MILYFQHLASLFAAEGNAFIDAAQGFVVPVVGAAAGGYALLRIARSDQNWDGLIDGLKSENTRKDEQIKEKDEQIAKLTARLTDLASFEHQREQVLKDLEAERESRRRTLERLSAKQIELARLQGALSAAGIDPDDVGSAVAEYMQTSTTTKSPTETKVGILVLDDDPLSAALVGDYITMRRPNWFIRNAPTIAAARDVDLHDIQVVISDWELKLDSTNAGPYIRYIQEHYPTKFVLVLTSHPADMIIKKVEEEGCKHVMVFNKSDEAEVRMAGVIRAIDNIAL